MGGEPSSPSSTRLALAAPLSSPAAIDVVPPPLSTDSARTDMGWVEMKQWLWDDDLRTIYDVVAYGVVVGGGDGDGYLDVRQGSAEFEVVGAPSDWTHLLDEKIRRELPVGETWVPRYEQVGGPIASPIADDESTASDSRVSRTIGVVRDTRLFQSVRLTRHNSPSPAPSSVPPIRYWSNDPEWNGGEWLQPGLFDRRRDLPLLRSTLAAHLFGPVANIVADYACLPAQTIVYSH